MSAIKALEVHAELNVNLATHAANAIKAGMSADEVVAILRQLADLIENND